MPLSRLLALACVLAAAPAAAQGFTVVPTPVDTDFRITSIAAGDYDGDGRTDLLLYGTRDLLTTVLELWHNTGSGAAWPFERVAFPDLPEAYPVGTASWVDLDGDGDLDLVLSDTEYPGDGNGPWRALPLRLYRNGGGGQFERVQSTLPTFNGTQLSAYARGLAWGDVDNDGDLDLAASGVDSGDGGVTNQSARLYTNTDGQFAATATLPAYRSGSVRWGDVDTDGALDLLVAEYSRLTPYGPAGSVRVVVNEGGALGAAVLVADSLADASADWGDFDLDGDLDVLVTGTRPVFEPGVPLVSSVRLYRNDGSGSDGPQFTRVDLLLSAPASAFSEIIGAQWADVDGDGDLDALVGTVTYVPGEYQVGRTVWLRNDAGALVDAGVDLPGPVEQTYGASAWADVDADGDLDYLFAGGFPERILINGQPGWCGSCDERFVFVRNDVSAPNAPPAAPAGLAATASADGVALSWAPAADDHTPAAALTYNLRVTALDGGDVVSPMSRPAGGGRLVPEAGNVSLNTAWALAGLAPGAYTWSVQAVDNAFNGGAFAAEGTFTVGAVAGEAPAAARALALGVAPNPSAGGATVSVATAAAIAARVSVVDALGREVAVLHDGPLAAGTHRLALSGLPAGVYVVRAAGAGVAASRTLTVVR